MMLCGLVELPCLEVITKKAVRCVINKNVIIIPISTIHGISYNRKYYWVERWICKRHNIPAISYRDFDNHEYDFTEEVTIKHHTPPKIELKKNNEISILKK